MNEDKELHDIARRLGKQAAERLDLERAAQAVVERLREPAAPAGRWTWTQPAWLRIAAAVVLLLGGALVGRRVLTGPGANSHGIAHYVTDDLTDLSTDELREVLSTLDATLDSTTSVPDESDFHGLNTQQLRAVLRSLEG